MWWERIWGNVTYGLIFSQLWQPCLPRPLLLGCRKCSQRAHRSHGLREGVLGVKGRGWTQLSGPRTQRPRDWGGGGGAPGLSFPRGQASSCRVGDRAWRGYVQQHKQAPARARHLAPRQGEPHCPTRLPGANPREAPTGPWLLERLDFSFSLNPFGLNLVRARLLPYPDGQRCFGSS